MRSNVRRFDSRYAAGRKLLRERVVRASRADPLLILNGSFAYGDFHLDARTGQSWSDVDLVASSATESRRRQLACLVADQLRSRFGIVLPVSVHPAPSFLGIAVADARFLAIGEYLRRSKGLDSSIDFLHAKMCLLLARSYTAERCLDVAHRLELPAVRRAAEVRIGKVGGFDLDMANEVLRSARNAEAALFAECCILRSPSQDFVGYYVSRLRRRADINGWLRDYLAGLIERAWSIY